MRTGLLTPPPDLLPHRHTPRPSLKLNFDGPPLKPAPEDPPPASAVNPAGDGKITTANNRTMKKKKTYWKNTGKKKR